MKVQFARLKPFFILAGIFSVCLSFSIVMWAMHSFGLRRTFVYKSTASDSLCIETRYLASDSAEGKIQNYIDELILGSISERCQNIFPKGTTLLSCFERNGELYVDFSDDLIRNADPKSTNFSESFALFCNNIQRNFPKLQKIYIFINGTEAYKQ
ncbi:MAG: GerMN domain-containing protein [Treponema sp.]|nr:GerMN domain-containing protein [Treponema sp.]